jgi:hypothetical protein
MDGVDTGSQEQVVGVESSCISAQGLQVTQLSEGVSFRVWGRRKYLEVLRKRSRKHLGFPQNGMGGRVRSLYANRGWLIKV